jgi:hypothetical protein
LDPCVIGYRVGAQKKIQTEAGATCVASLVKCQMETRKAYSDGVLLSSTGGLLFMLGAANWDEKGAVGDEFELDGTLY